MGLCGYAEEAAIEHDPIKPIDGVEGAYFVSGPHSFNSMMSFSRNMVIIKHNAELTLVDPMPLSPEGEAELEKLGTVKRLIRLGHFHGSADAYYKEKYGVELWATGSSSTYPDIPIEKIINEDTDLPFPDAQLVVFDINEDTGPGSEAVLRYKNLLITCDSLQYYEDYSHSNWFAKMMLPVLGFKGLCIGPPWHGVTASEEKTLEADFERIMDLNFDKLVAAHGNVYESEAKRAVRVAIDAVYKKE